MCDPGTLIALTIASGVIGVAGVGLSAAQAASNAKYQERVAKRNAALENESAANEIQNTRLEALQHYRRVAQLRSEQRVSAAANGVAVDFGNQADVFSETTKFGREDAKRIFQQGYQSSRGYEINASNYVAQARQANQNRKNAITSGIFNTASTALGAAQQYSKYRAGQKTPGGN